MLHSLYLEQKENDFVLHKRVSEHKLYLCMYPMESGDTCFSSVKKLSIFQNHEWKLQLEVKAVKK